MSLGFKRLVARSQPKRCTEVISYAQEIIADIFIYVVRLQKVNCAKPAQVMYRSYFICSRNHCGDVIKVVFTKCNCICSGLHVPGCVIRFKIAILIIYYYKLRNLHFM